METNSFLTAYVALSLMPRINSRIYLPVFERCGGIDAFFKETPNTISALEQEFNIIIPPLKNVIQLAEEERNNMQKHNIQVISIESQAYSPLLCECEDAPLVLFYRGTLPNSSQKLLAIVGTRRASIFYTSCVEQLVSELSTTTQSVVIVSGLAYGIDAAAHRAALQHNLSTCAVLGHGLHMIYPATHHNLADRIVANGGCLLSEYPTSAAIIPANFLKRNRIIAGLCHATLIAESAIKGGAISTARIAASYNRDVAALPGRPNDVMSLGCNMLIKQNIAALVENATDIIRILNLENTQPATPSPQLSLPFDDNQQQESSILNLLRKNEKTHIDDLSRILRIPISDLMVTLLKMEFEDKVTVFPGKNYSAK